MRKMKKVKILGITITEKEKNILINELRQIVPLLVAVWIFNQAIATKKDAKIERKKRWRRMLGLE